MQNNTQLSHTAIFYFFYSILFPLFKVHTIQRRVRYRRGYYTRYSTENCAVAVRAASDVFMIYGCGRRGKWEIHRSNCDSKNEYLIVFKKGSRYEVILSSKGLARTLIRSY